MSGLFNNRKAWACGLLVLALFVIAGSARAQVSVVVGKASKHTAGEAELKSYFSAVKFDWADKAKVQIVDQPESDLAKVFYETFVGSSVTQVRKEWMKLILSGQAVAPLKCANDAEVKKAVAADPNAVGFIATASLDGTVREIAKLK
jgi:ABC-type phosphate transport system substrate-binding protein